ncbi:hypothetical protein NGF19_09885 [Streptomyces sp. RY43-2]|uniref:Serine hydrolase n=1 Tax=Streptomyces macrolidinus TaxID=2952607 RepID=A0ABT0ZCI1_9ACTN|nr:hypothetical protein [Streptomyces macrolidinus]MCN9241097.1 hypothetical protein [Streptomyces macrolidinus]
MSEADDHRPAEVPEPPPASRAWWHPSRLLRGRVRPAVATAVVGVLLGVAGTAWQTGTGPFRDDRTCWDALDTGDLKRVFREPDKVVAEETAVQYRDLLGYSGVCRMSTGRGAVTVNVHQLDEHYDGLGRWGTEFLAPRLVPMGGGLLGMASDTRAWLALPEGCVGRPSGLDGPTVVDIDTGWTVQDREVDKKERAGLTHMVVKLVNRIIDQEGCSGTVVDPSDRLPAADDIRAEDRPDAVCGIKGLTFPARSEDDTDASGGKKGGKRGGKDRTDDSADWSRVQVTPDGGPVRACDHIRVGSTGLRLMTVSDPRLAALFERSRSEYGTPLKGARGSSGSLSARNGVFWASCQTGDVAFVARNTEWDSSALLHTVFPRYIEAEAIRVGCGTLKVTTGTSEGS